MRYADGMMLNEGFALTVVMTVTDGFALSDGTILADGIALTEGFALTDGIALPCLMKRSIKSIVRMIPCSNSRL